MIGSRFLALILSAAVILGPSASFAQGFDFGSSDDSGDDGAAASTNGDDTPSDSASDDGSMTFDTSDAALPSSDDSGATVAVIALPSPNMNPDQRFKIENKMMEVLKTITKNNYVGSDTVMSDLQSRGMLDCVREPLCLGTVGVNNNVDQLLMARLEPTPGGGRTLSIDLFEAKDKLTLKYVKREGLKTEAEILDAIKPMLYEVFDVRAARVVKVNQGSSIISPIIAWSSLALAVGAAGAGAYFTYAAKKGDDKLKKSIEDKDITQVQAKKDNEAIKNKQTISYVFYGLAGGLAVVSVVFFSLNVGGDVSVDQGDSQQSPDETASIQDLRLAPIFSPDGAGLSAGFRF